MGLEQATREIMWNVSGTLNSVLMYLLFIIALVIGFNGIFRQVELWISGKPAPEHLGHWTERFLNMFHWGFMQHGVSREKSVAIAHTLIYIGFLALLFATTMVFIDHDLAFLAEKLNLGLDLNIYEGKFYIAVTILSDILGFGVLLGIALIAKRRYIDEKDQLHNQKSDAWFLIIIATLIVQGFILEGLRIHVTQDAWAAYSPIGLLTAKFFWFLSNTAAKNLHFLMWWFHTITFFIVVAITPYTKFFHILASTINLYFKSSGRPKGALKNPGDIEKLIETEEDFSLGTNNIQDYTWKQLMDLDACTSCGRCQSECPAYNSNKPLSPKWLILDTRNHALALNADEKIANSFLPKIFKKIDKFLTQEFFLKSSGVRMEDQEYKADGVYRAQNQAVQSSVLNLAQDSSQAISGSVMDSNVFWSCTTCYACVSACPVGIDHVDQIISNRRDMVLMQGEMPSEAQATLRSIESQANPYGPAEERKKWFEDLDLPIVSAGDEVEFLYWVGCVSAFDKRKQKIARSLVSIMKHANLSFGVLGNAEGCTGDPARRLGEENLFQTLAKQNIETLKSIKFKYLVANCPHCFNTIKNEYPQFGNLSNGEEPEIIHHSQLINKLLKEEKIKLDPKAEEFTFHDPCYLGRYNDEYEAPRDVVKKSTSLNIVEMEKSRDKGMCCGAGGGHFWMDLKIGDRINTIRAEQAAETGVNKVATACPFCLQMMEDGTKLSEKAQHLEVEDIAELIAKRLV